MGCGAGGTIAAFASDYTCVGIDPSLDAITFARGLHPNVQFLHGSSEQLQNIRTPVSCCLLLDVLEHIEDDVGFLQRIVLSLPPGGCLLITVPAEMALWSKHDQEVGHFRRYSAETLMQTWKDLPVQVKLLAPLNTRLYTLIRLLRALTRPLQRTWGGAGMDFFLPPKVVNTVLRRIFAAESRPLVAALSDPRRSPRAHGVSLLAILGRRSLSH
ncbi:hypothetical protein A3H22_02815 [Candidatus Peribacteria bacterium RIFCSPLOWO2_12_FULL_55_15]|nr:MAG: hypothetical protein A2789_04200 [Candidatus Peribacteria bacterium RIFCSPHIGHO2_01_FULL_54_22]OGJ63278.1 MAG: hypothetical protein A3D12_03025 [Candidatus Peribacteria bacterium RIFCSPHIGHO2_02_FULL_55_24]OGJ63867.1 MAG: hypothetical protein A3E47_01295 [Candidatus Peribacteria bacterium RIFCSPHIGHO2_12_FULL_54_10]OGJ70589.1 MAG: hypothetical protein A3H22_02815 [Candidatus Peribacteria bacterium RIFCSPLOWO2_12_FULL_55_15]